MPTDPRRLGDAAALKALAHPLRLELLQLLVSHGAMTATELAAHTGESPSNCSWHLRKLAEHGFVEEAGARTGRNRPWQALDAGLTWGDGEEDTEASAAGDAVADLLLERELVRMRAAREHRRREEPAWRDAASVNHVRLWLTADEAREISDRMVELFLAKSDRGTDPTRRPPGSRLVSLVGWVAPAEPPADDSPRGGGDRPGSAG